MTTPEELYVYYCRRCDSGPCKPNSGVCDALRGFSDTSATPLTEIDLNQNYVGPMGIEPVLCVCKGMKATLRSVRLANNMLQHREIVLISQYLSGRNTKTILSPEEHKKAGSNIAAAADEEDEPSQADLYLHPVTATTGTSASLSITSVRQLSFLQSLDLRSNLIHDGSVPQLLYLLRMTPTLTELLVEGNQLTASSLKQIEDQLAKNRLLLATDEQVHDDYSNVSKDVSAANTAALSELRRLQRQQLPHTSELHGELTTATSGGYLSYPSWRRNPQFVLSTYFAPSNTIDGGDEHHIGVDTAYLAKMRRNHKVTITLLMDAPIISTRRFGFCIMRGHSVLRVVDVTTDPSVVIVESDTSDTRCSVTVDLDNLTLQQLTTTATSTQQQQHPLPLVVMVYSFTPGKQTGFTLRAELEDKTLMDSCPGSFVHIEPLNPTFDWVENTVSGRWSVEKNNDVISNVSAGGPLKAASWRNNSAFRVCLGGSSSPSRRGEMSLAARATQEATVGSDPSAISEEEELTQAERAAEMVEAAQKAATTMSALLKKASGGGGGNRTAISTSVSGPSSHQLSKGKATLYITLTQHDKDDTPCSDAFGFNNDGSTMMKSIGFYLITPDSRGRIPVYLGDKKDAGGSTTPTTTAAYPPASLIGVCEHKSDQSVGITVDIPIHMLDFLIVPTTDAPLVTGAYTLSVFSSCAITISHILPPGLTRSEAPLVQLSDNIPGSPPSTTSVNRAAVVVPHGSMWASAILEGEFDEVRCGGAVEHGGEGWTHNPSYEFTIGEEEEQEGATTTTTTISHNLDICLAVEPTFFHSGTGGCVSSISSSSRPGTAAHVLQTREKELRKAEIKVSLYALTRGGTNVDEIRSAKAAATSATNSSDSSSTLPLYKRHELVSVGSSPYLSMSTASDSLINPPEASFYVSTLPPGRYIALVSARSPGTVGCGFGYRLRMLTSSSSSSFHPLTRRLFGLMGTAEEKNSNLLSYKKRAQEAKMKADAHNVTATARGGGVAALPPSMTAMSDTQQSLVEQALRAKAQRDVDSLFADVEEGASAIVGEVAPAGHFLQQKHAPLIDAVNMSLSDRLRAQRLQDYEDEAAFAVSSKAPPVSGTSTTTSAGTGKEHHKFAGCNVTELLRDGRKFVDREFPPSSSSLWLDPDNMYPEAPRVASWKRATEIASSQALGIIDNTFSAQSGLGGGKLAKKTLETLLSRRAAGLGIVRLCAKVDAEASPASIDPDSALALRTLEGTLLGQHQHQQHSAAVDDEGEEKDIVGEQNVSAGHRRGQEVSAIMAKLGEYVTPPLYTGCASDADQAHLGSHWYLSALGCVLAKPSTFGRRFIVGYNAQAGVAQFRFYIDNAWRNVLVDDSLPVDAAGELCFATSSSQGDFLAPLVEKAYAKVHHCYGALHGDLGVVKKAVLGTDGPTQTRGNGTGVLVPAPPGSSSSARPRPHSQPLATTADGNSNDIIQPRSGRLGVPMALQPTQPASARNTVGLVSSIGGRSVVLSTDPSRGNNSNPNRPSTARAAALTLTCPDNDRAAYGATALRGGGGESGPKRPFYDHGGEPALVMLSQALTDFTGGIVQIFDNTPPTAGSITKDANSIGNNTLPSDRYHAAGLLPPNMSIAVSGSLYIDEEAYLKGRDAASNNVLASDISATSFTYQQRIKSKKDSVWDVVMDGVHMSERLFAGGLLQGTHGWQQKKHCGLGFDSLYPFVDAKEADGRRIVKVLNNWGHSESNHIGAGSGSSAAATGGQLWWKGKYAWGTSAPTPSAEGWTPALKVAAGYDVTDSALTFWMSLDEVLYYFSHFFQVDYPSHRAKCEGGYGASHIGGSLLNSSWVNNHQYQLTLHHSDDNSNQEEEGGGDIEAKEKEGDEYQEITIGVHQLNDRSRMSRHRNASYTYSKRPIGLALIQTTSSSPSPSYSTTATPLRRLALLTSSEHITTLHPAALRDRYVSLRLPRFTTTEEGERVATSFVVVPYIEKVGDRGVAASEVSGSNGRLFTHQTDEAENPYLPPQPVDYTITVHSHTCPVALQAIPDDTRVVVDGTWSAQNGVGVGGQVCIMPPTPLPLSTIPDGPPNVEGGCGDATTTYSFTAGGPPGCGTWRCNPQYLLYPSKSCDITITLRQSNISSVEHIGFHIIDSADANLRRILHFPPSSSPTTDVIATTTSTVAVEGGVLSAARTGTSQLILTVPHSNSTVVTGTTHLQSIGERLGRPYHLVPSCLRAGAEGNFSIEVTTNVPVRLERVPARRDWKALSFSSSMTITEGNAGGCIQYPTWRNNPQYLLKFPTEKAGRILIGVTNTSPSTSSPYTSGSSSPASAHEPIGVLLLRPDTWGKGRGRKLLLNTPMSRLVPTLSQDRASDVPANQPARYPEQNSRRYTAGSVTSPGVLLLEDARVSTSATSGGGDVVVDSGVAVHHSEVIYDVALGTDTRHQHFILMPYTLHPLTETNLQITIYSTMDVEVDAVEERVGGYMRGLSTTATSAGSIASFASNSQHSTRGVSNYSSLRRRSTTKDSDQEEALPPPPASGMQLVAPPPPAHLANKTFVCTAEGQWVPGVSAGGCRRYHLSSWVNNPFYRVTLLPSAMQLPKSEGLKMIIVAIQYPDGPERPEMKKLTMKTSPSGGGSSSKTNSSTRVVTMPPVVTTASSLEAFTDLNKVVPSSSSSGNTARKNKGAAASLSVAQRSPFALDLVKAIEVPIGGEGSESPHQRAHSAASDVVRYEPIGSTLYTYESEISTLLDGSSGAFGSTNTTTTTTTTASAAITTETDTDPDSFYIVPHTYEPECAAFFKLIIYSNLPVQLTELKKGKRFW